MWLIPTNKDWDGLAVTRVKIYHPSPTGLGSNLGRPITSNFQSHTKLLNPRFDPDSSKAHL